MAANPLPPWKRITQTLWFLLLLPFLLLGDLLGGIGHVGKHSGFSAD
jgi:hypothetical protein